MTNHEIARRFQQIADILEIQGENPFKVRAYRKAVETIEDLDDSLADIAARNGLGDLPGFGEAIISKTQDFLDTGTTALWDRIKDSVPSGVVAMASLPGIGPKTAKALWDALSVTSIDELEKAAREERIRTVAGFGPAKERNILEAIERGRRLRERLPLYVVLPYAERMVAALRGRPEVTQASVAGSLRRRKETVGDIDLVAATTDPTAAATAFATLPGIVEVTERGTEKVTGLSDLGLRVDLRLSRPEDYGALLHHFTSGREHNRELRLRAERQGLKVNEFGIFRTSDDVEVFTGADENEVYVALGLQAVPPELRDRNDAIELAEKHALPVLITEADFRGQLHEHSNYSDGSATVRQMAEAAMARGYEYLAITDHSASLRIANGMTRDRHLRQLDEIAALNEEYAGRFTLLTGIEADILADGSLDCDDDILERLDVVVGSVHIRFKEDEAAMTRRIVTALSHPRLRILGHPTGRLLGRREPYPVDIDAVIEAARTHGKVLEINASPDRMDLNDVYARKAKERGVKITVNADAHSPAGLGLLAWGLFMARRAGLTADDVINTYPLERLRA
ncbi:MAG: DNA polymerase/3'-5' exonuclease PolX [Capsulimonadales bacterium]|nr:DNA polymerase/3'-5' exonuclease PolX [Capsulimonadales bacterium]